jgi:hypothetical protein
VNETIWEWLLLSGVKGEKLWESPLGTGAVAAPATYLVDGKQYVSIAVGWGGVFGISQRATEAQNPGTVYTFVDRRQGAAATDRFVEMRMQRPVAVAGGWSLVWVSRPTILTFFSTNQSPDGTKPGQKDSSLSRYL